MAICKFFQQGNCRKGNKCDFEHIKGGPVTYSTSETGSSERVGRRRSERRNSQQAQSEQEQNFPPSQSSRKYKNKPKQQGGQSSPQRTQKQFKKPHNKPKQAQQPNRPQQPNKPKQSNKPQTPDLPSIKDFVDMVMTDLAWRPCLWHFSSYGLTLNSTQSIPFPHLGTTEISPDELRLQVYAEAAATGGRIENYINVVNQIKQRAESATKALIPNLEPVLLEFLKLHNIPLDKKDILKQELLLRRSQSLQEMSPQVQTQQFPQSHSQLQPQTNVHANQSYESLLTPHPHPYVSSNLPTASPSHQIIPDSEFSFGMIPEMPPE